MATRKDIEDYVKKSGHPKHIVVIYADWCGACSAMKERLGDKFVQYNYLTFLEESNVADEMKDYFPHVHIYENGQRRDGRLRDVFQLVGN